MRLALCRIYPGRRKFFHGKSGRIKGTNGNVAEEIAAVGVSERFGLDDRLTEKNDFCQKGSFKFMKTLDMTEGKPVKLILKFAIQLFIGMLLQQLYNITDTMIVGYGFGENAVAAVGGTSALYSVLMNFANGLNNGYGIIISRAFGGKDWKKLRQGFAVMVILDVAITLVLTLVSLILLRPLLFWLDTLTFIIIFPYG